jgi:uncharacterized protein (DUF2267 family)
MKERHLEQFLERVCEGFPPGLDVDPERLARSVFTVLARRVSEGEIGDVKGMLPEEVRELWPDASTPGREGAAAGGARG